MDYPIDSQIGTSIDFAIGAAKNPLSGYLDIATVPLKSISADIAIVNTENELTVDGNIAPITATTRGSGNGAVIALAEAIGYIDEEPFFEVKNPTDGKAKERIGVDHQAG